ncbi:related to cyclin pclA [Cephalotrichum gorgonifer]|uniref:Related to cyclin pclA n=1 Tax=Cephalotrichum gorgonifer TaxID=2041049 RepID=A0AAE8N4W6_9PEZI|nr:related to cyclin pclA [Cephalotrichum gorgonifer]
MDSPRLLSSKELKEAAIHKLITSRVDSRMIRYLAASADAVIPCDKNMMPSQPRKYHRTATAPADLPTPPTTPELRAVQPEDPTLPTVEQFIRKLVESSNVQAATLMPALVYLNRLKDRLQPMSRGLRCTSHRIFLACLILAAKYVNDISPKNKHWARYTNSEGPGYQFGFCTSEVNLMEKQLLQLLDWDLRITEEELGEAWGEYARPIREKMEAENRRQYHSWCRENAMRFRPAMDPITAATAAAATAAAAASAVGTYHAPHNVSGYYGTQAASPAYSRTTGSVSPPALSDAGSSASSTSGGSSRPGSRATTPGSAVSIEHTVVYTPSHHVELEYPPREYRKRLLPYEITPEQAMAREGGGRTNKIPRASRGVFSRVFGSAMMAR